MKDEKVFIKTVQKAIRDIEKDGQARVIMENDSWAGSYYCLFADAQVDEEDYNFEEDEDFVCCLTSEDVQNLRLRAVAEDTFWMAYEVRRNLEQYRTVKK